MTDVDLEREAPTLTLNELFMKIDGQVNHPDHYNSDGIEVIDVIEAFTKDLQGPQAFCVGNAIKYICRWDKKGGAQDIKKAIWYLNRLLDEIKEK